LRAIDLRRIPAFRIGRKAASYADAMRRTSVHCRAVACLNAPKPNTLNTSDTHLKVLRHLEDNPEITQRELAKELGISLGKANYCLKALIEKGWVKANNFKNSNNKSAYAYLLTPTGIERKAQITARYLRRKMEEYEALKHEIEQLKAEMESP
jgi:EPS-associated MarR family transcriptional regulator